LLTDFPSFRACEVSGMPVSVTEPMPTTVAAEETGIVLGMAELEKKLVMPLDIGRLLATKDKRVPAGVERSKCQAVAGAAVAQDENTTAFCLTSFRIQCITCS